MIHGNARQRIKATWLILYRSKTDAECRVMHRITFVSCARIIDRPFTCHAERKSKSRGKIVRRRGYVNIHDRDSSGSSCTIIFFLGPTSYERQNAPIANKINQTQQRDINPWEICLTCKSAEDRKKKNKKKYLHETINAKLQSLNNLCKKPSSPNPKSTLQPLSMEAALEMDYKS